MARDSQIILALTGKEAGDITITLPAITVSSSSQSSSFSVSKAEATATAKAEAVTNIHSAVSDLRDDADHPDVKEALDTLDQSRGATPEELEKTGVLSKLERLVKNGQDANTKFGKFVGGAEKTVKNLQKVGRFYNAIAKWVPTAPELPDALLGKK